MRLPALIAVLAVAASIGLCAGSASAQFFQDQSFIYGRRHAPQGPWCANTSSGDRVEQDCSFNSFEACRRSLMSISSDFCTQSFSGSVRPVRRTKGDRRRR